MSMYDPELRAAVARSSGNRSELERSEVCGCFYCLAIFSLLDHPQANWLGGADGEQTLLCPLCEIDAVIGAASGFPIEVGFLERVHKFWFQQPRPSAA